MKNIIWHDTYLDVLDQTLLPNEVKYVKCYNHIDVAELIKRLAVRGAPLIGVAAAYGMVLARLEISGSDLSAYKEHMDKAHQLLASTRPTAVNLFWALDEMKRVWQINSSFDDLLIMADKIYRDDNDSCHKIGEIGKVVIPNTAGVLTHCNAGALATADYGTALGVIRSAHTDGKVSMVYADETRPLLQGARLTAFELKADGIPVTLITDNMAAHIMKEGLVDVVIVGADRIAANGDTANKIGTYGVAILAKHHNIPMYVAAPLSTFDLSIKSGEEIVIEERDGDEIRKLYNDYTAPKDVMVRNPAFDVTPNYLIDGIITEYGIIYSPNVMSIMSFMKEIEDGQSK